MNKITELAHLEIIFGPHAGDIVTISKTPWSIGREVPCDYIVESERISRQHMRIIAKDGRWFLVNLKSTNGTVLNETRLLDDEEKVLVDGDEIQLGKTIRFRFKDPTKTLSESQDQVIIPGLWVNAETSDVFVQMKDVSPPFKSAEVAFLSMLSQSPNKIFTKAQIKEKLWPHDDPAGITDEAVHTKIKRIRERLRILDDQHEYIETIHGIGARFIQRDA